VAFAAGSIGVSNLVGPRRPNPTKLGAYESGNEPLADVPGTRFSVKFYMVAMLFLIFDVEAVFVYPWAVVLRELGWAGLWQMVVFLGILASCRPRDRRQLSPKHVCPHSRRIGDEVCGPMRVTAQTDVILTEVELTLRT